MRKGPGRPLAFRGTHRPRPLATQLVPVGNKLENETGRSFHLSLSLCASSSWFSFPFPSLLMRATTSRHAAAAVSVTCTFSISTVRLHVDVTIVGKNLVTIRVYDAYI